MSRYPEHDKVEARRSEVNAINQFLRWVEQEEEDALCYKAYHNGPGSSSWWVVSSERRIARLMARYFGIDYEAFQQEKDQMLSDFVEGLG